MSKALSVIFAAIIACSLLYFYPAATGYQQQDDIAYNVAYKAVTNFVDAVRNKGYLTPTMYNDFSRSLESTGNVFDIQMEHDEEKMNPYYTNPARSGTFQNSFEVYYDASFTSTIMAKLFPNNSKPMTDRSRWYFFHEGDYFSITVKNKNFTKATLIRDFLNRGNTGDPTVIYIPYGGMVLNENY